MIDYSHVPIHIKCTERWKIDPHYPKDGCRWWKFQLERPEYITRFLVRGVNGGAVDRAKEIQEQLEGAHNED